MVNKYYNILRKGKMNFSYLIMKKMGLELVFEKWVKFEWMYMNELGMEKGESMSCV